MITGNTTKQSLNIFDGFATIIAKIHNRIWPWQTPKKWVCGVRLEANFSDPAVSSYYQTIEYNQADELVNYHLADINIPKGVCLDIGCGVGGMTYGLASTGRWFPNIGLDIDKSRIESAADFAEINSYNGDCNFVVGDGKRLPLKEAAITLVFGIAMLEHVYEPTKLVKEAVKVLKEGGIAVFVFPPFLSPQFRHLSHIIKIPWAHLLLGEKMTMAVAREILRINGKTVTLPDVDYSSPTAGLYPMSVMGFIKTLRRFDKITLEKVYFKRQYKFLPLLNYFPLLTDIFSNYVLIIIKKDDQKHITWTNIAHCWIKAIQTQLDIYIKIIKKSKTMTD